MIEESNSRLFKPDLTLTKTFKSHSPKPFFKTAQHPFKAVIQEQEVLDMDPNDFTFHNNQKQLKSAMKEEEELEKTSDFRKEKHSTSQE